jgi:Periplasmic binding protein
LNTSTHLKSLSARGVVRHLRHWLGAALSCAFWALLFASALPAAANQFSREAKTIAVFISSDFDGCYVPGVIQAIQQFTQNAADEINSRGGIAGSQIRLSFHDDEDDAAKTITGMEKALADPQLLAMIGIPSSTRGKAVFDQHGEAIGASGVPFITEVSLNQMFAQHPNVFTMASAVDNELEVLRAFVAAGGYKRPAFIGREGDLYTGAIGDGLAELPDATSLVADHRLRIEDYKLTPGSADAAIADLKANAPDLIFMGLGSGPGATFAQALDDAGVDAPVFIVLGRITRILNRAKDLDRARPFYQFGWDGVPNAYNERLRHRIWETGERSWIFNDRPAELTPEEWKRRGCQLRSVPVQSVMDDKNRRAIGRGAQYRDMLSLVVEAAQRAPEGAGLTEMRRYIVDEITAHKQGRRMHHGWWQDWSFTPKRASAGDTLIVERAAGTSDITLAPQQYVRVAGQLRPRPVVYISLDLISMSRIDTNDRSFDAEFYLSFRSEAPDIDISDIHFTNAYRAQTGKDKLISWREIHGGQESSSFPSNVKLYRVSGKFNFEPELGRYPFDTQRLSVSFQPASASQPFLIQPPSAQSITTPFSIDGWAAKDRYVGSDQDIIPTIDRHLGDKRLVPFYKFNYTWVVSRNATDYYLRVIVPLGFILLVTYFSIFLGHARFDSTVAIQVTALLSAIALYLALPKVDSDQATLSDKVFMITYAMVSFMIGLSVLKDWGYVGERTAVRRLVSFIQTVVYPVIAIGLMTSLVAGPMFLAEMSEKLSNYIGGLIGWA